MIRINPTKQDLRIKYRKIRRSIKNRALLDKKIAENFFESVVYHGCSVIAGYLPIDGEVNALPIMMEFLKLGKKVVVPVVGDNRMLHFCNWQNNIKIKEAKNGLCIANVMPDLIIVPLVAFNKDCARLGFGGGYFDRTIQSLRCKHCLLCVGISYQQQMCRNLIPQNHDQPLDAVITQSAVYLH